jgi:hypothetical protein
MPDPNPELYPPYANQTYVKVHDMNTYGVTATGYAVRTISNWVSVNGGPFQDTYVSGPDYSDKAKYQVVDGLIGLVWVKSTSTPYVRASSGAGIPLAFDSMSKASAAIQNLPTVTDGKYSFWGRNPRFEMAQALDAYKQNADEFASVDAQITAGLTARNVTNANTIYNYVAGKVINQDSNQQYVLGLSAASGGGQNTTYLANSLSAIQLQSIAENAFKEASSTPIVTPFESPLIAEAHSQAVEAKNAGEIRDQQIRQSISSAQGVLDALRSASSAEPDYASIIVGAYGQLGAARQT